MEGDWEGQQQAENELEGQNQQALVDEDDEDEEDILDMGSDDGQKN